MGKFIDLTGRKFGRLTVIERSTNRGEKVAWLCKCECGNIHVSLGNSLLRGKTKSCGCIREEKPNRTKHGMWGTPIHSDWGNIKKRCYNPKSEAYGDYGGRGIAMCDRWRESFEAFYEDVSKLPHFGEQGYTLNRINNNGDYEPDNVEWADRVTQNNNKRNSLFVEYNGKKQTIAQWAKEYNMSYTTLWSRLYKYHWSIQKALEYQTKKNA